MLIPLVGYVLSEYLVILMFFMSGKSLLGIIVNNVSKELIRGCDFEELTSMTRNAAVAILIGMMALTSGCQRLNYGYGQQVQPLPAAPAQPVAEGGALQPLVLTPDPSQPTPIAPGQDPNAVVTGAPLAGDVVAGTPGAVVRPPVAGDVAAVEPQSGPKIGRTDLLGGWTVTSAGESCKLFMNLTTWSGGYRASTRGCSLGVLGKIAAWDLNGSQVVLRDAAGVDMAHLFMNAPERFNGQTAGGQPIAFYR